MTAAHLSTALRRCKFHRLYCYRNPAISPPLAIVKSTDTVKVARAIRTQPIQVMKHGGRMTTSPISEPAATTLRMLEVFGSVGATRFTMTWTNTAGMPRSPRSLQQRLQSIPGPMPSAANDDWCNAVHISGINYADLHRIMPTLLTTALSERLNLILRPEGSQVSFIQLDDLKIDRLPRIAPAMFLALETSPGNFQAWLALSERHDKDFARRVRKGAGADPSASGATRVAGSLNFKDKYAPDFPRVAIDAARLGHFTDRSELDRLGLVAPPEEFAPVSPPSSVTIRQWPSYAKAVDGAPVNLDGSGPDRSRADYWWCFLAIAWGHSVSEPATRLLEVSSKAREMEARSKGYAELTARNAALAVERRRRLTR